MPVVPNHHLTTIASCLEYQSTDIWINQVVRANDRWLPCRLTTVAEERAAPTPTPHQAQSIKVTRSDEPSASRTQVLLVSRPALASNTQQRVGREG